MKVLLVESQPGNARTMKEQLRTAGHEVVMCSDDAWDGPCRSVADASACPLHEHVDLAVVAKPEEGPDTLLEMGAVCAERRRIPVVRLDPQTCADPVQFLTRAAAGGKDRMEAAYAAVVRADLGDLHLHATVEATREPDRVQIVVGFAEAADAATRSRAADRARAAVRTFDPFVRSIDVSVESPHEEATS
jgi:CheY-like chemotaxis protein